MYSAKVAYNWCELFTNYMPSILYHCLDKFAHIVRAGVSSCFKNIEPKKQKEKNHPKLLT